MVRNKILLDGDGEEEMNNSFDMLWNSTYLTKYNINDFIVRRQ